MKSKALKIFILCSLLVFLQKNIYAEDAKLIQGELIAPSEVLEAMEAYNLGTRYLHSGDYQRAEAPLRKAIKLDSKFVDAYDHLGIVLRRTGRLDEALEVYAQSMALNSKNSVPYTNTALIYSQQNKPNEAIDMYRVATEKFPENPEGYYGAGTVYFSYGYNKEAIEALTVAMELYTEQNSPYLPDAYYMLGLSYLNLEDYPNARKYLDLAKPTRQKDPQFKKAYKELLKRE